MRLAYWLLALLWALTFALDRATADQPLATFRDCPACPEMVVIPAGTLLMGASEADKAQVAADVPHLRPGFSLHALLGEDEARRAERALAREQPQHQVVISRPFALGKYPVTAGAYFAFVRSTGHRSTGCSAVGARHADTSGVAWQHPGFEVALDDPVVCVDWHDAEAYIAWLNESIAASGQEGNGLYRLPSEAEWEYAARGGTLTVRWWGDDVGIDMTKCNGCLADLTDCFEVTGRFVSEFKRCRRYRYGPTTVGSFPANPFGLYDMLGNIAQWTQDCDHDSYRDAPANAAPWMGHSCDKRIVRGAAWRNEPWMVRAAMRGAMPATMGSTGVGFRVAKTLP